LPALTYSIWSFIQVNIASINSILTIRVVEFAIYFVTLNQSLIWKFVPPLMGSKNS
jgi:hypothetical protein